jgi:alkylation response protein AidB-like acyl-CoA dehydrogenase
MHFELSEEQLAVQAAARDFAQNVLKPGVIDRDEHQRFPTEEVKQLAERFTSRNAYFMGMGLLKDLTAAPEPQAQ